MGVSRAAGLAAERRRRAPVPMVQGRDRTGARPTSTAEGVSAVHRNSAARVAAGEWRRPPGPECPPGPGRRVA